MDSTTVTLTQPQYRVLDAVAHTHVRRTDTGIDCIDRRRQTPSGAGFVTGRGARVRMVELIAAGLVEIDTATKFWRLTPAGVPVHAAWLTEQEQFRTALQTVSVRRAD